MARLKIVPQKLTLTLTGGVSLLLLMFLSRNLGIKRFSTKLNSLNKFTDEEKMIKEAVKKFAADVIAPKVKEMDENEQMDPNIITSLFENGVKHTVAYGYYLMTLL